MARKAHGYPVLILGGGRGGSALLEMFVHDDLVHVVALCDLNPAAPGMQLAERHGIPVFTDALAALEACSAYPDCIVYNLTHDDAIAAEISKVFGNRNVTSGVAAKLIWQMVTNLKRIKAELEASQGQLQAIIAHAMDGIITSNETGEIQGFNPAAENIFGYAQDELLGKNVSILVPPLDDAADEHLRNYLSNGHQGGTVGVRGREVTALRKNGERFPMELSASEMQLNGRRYFIGIFRDVTERKLAEQKIAHLAHHDYLTDLPNRALFLDRLEQALSLARRSQHKLGVLFLDLDGFKAVNDSCGHEAGDQLLRAVALRLKDVVRESDTIARIGGDEFTFVLHDVGSTITATAVAQKILAALAPPFTLAHGNCRIGASIGIALFPDDANDAKTLLRMADEAMYAAKQNGKNTYAVYGDTGKSPRIAAAD